MLYEEREIDELDTYIDHVSAMTTEGLHSKSAIAAELAFRDEEVSTLKKKIEVVMNLINAVAHVGVDCGCGKYTLTDEMIAEARALSEDYIKAN